MPACATLTSTPTRPPPPHYVSHILRSVYFSSAQQGCLTDDALRASELIADAHRSVSIHIDFCQQSLTTRVWWRARERDKGREREASDGGLNASPFLSFRARAVSARARLRPARFGADYWRSYDPAPAEIPATAYGSPPVLDYDALIRHWPRRPYMYRATRVVVPHLLLRTISFSPCSTSYFALGRASLARLRPTNLTASIRKSPSV
jgi:hypothetical protein